MEITYRIKDSPDPGDNDLHKGILEINKNNYQKALKHFKKASNYENEHASLFTAVFYFTGFGLNKRHPKKAVDLLHKLALNWNNPVAQFLLGGIFSEGDDDIPANHPYGLYWLTAAANNGWVDAIYLLGRRYVVGEKDHETAVSYFEAVAKTKKDEITSVDDPVHYLFGNQDFEMNFTKVDPDIVNILKVECKGNTVSLVKDLGKLNESDIPNFQEIKHLLLWNSLVNVRLGIIMTAKIFLTYFYYSGVNNISKDHEKAMYWAKEAAKSGDAPEFTMVAQFYENGVGVDQNYEEAMKWHEQSQILKEDSKSNFFIGKLYFFGLGVKKDHELALAYFELMLSHNEKHCETLFYMGNIFEKGEDGVPLNYGKALKYYYKAFLLDCSKGATSIGYLYHNGQGVKKDMAKAYEWFIEGSSMNCAAADYMLGIYYLHGYHVKEDFFKAMELFKRSSEANCEEADEIIQNLIRAFS